MTDISYEKISRDTIRSLHQDFISSIEEKAIKVIPSDAVNADELLNAVKELLISCVRKDIGISQSELSNLVKRGQEALKLRNVEVDGSVHKRRLSMYFDTKSATFSSVQKEEIRAAEKKRKDAPDVLRVFDGEERIYLRMGSDLKGDVEQKVAAYLKQKKYKILDYNKGYATDEKGKQQFKIGKLLKSNPDLLKEFSDDYMRTLDSLMVVVSRKADDIARMSTGRAWVSCMGSNGVFYEHVREDIRCGTLIAYLVSEKDPDIVNPLARMLIKPFSEKGGGLTAIAKRFFLRSSKQIFVADKIYGLHNNSFSKVVERFVEEHLNHGKNGDFKILSTLYQDGCPSSKFVGTGCLKEGKVKKWYQYSQLHREDGPAIEYPNGDKKWYQNGNLHRDDGPAVEMANGDKRWYQNDDLHRDDGPAIEMANGNKKWCLNGKEVSEKDFNAWRQKKDARPTVKPKIHKM